MKILKSIKKFFFKEKEKKEQSEESKNFNQFLSDRADDLGNESKKS